MMLLIFIALCFTPAAVFLITCAALRALLCLVEQSLARARRAQHS